MNENQTLINIKTAIDQCNGVTCVYLVATRAGNQCYIKVGRTANLKKRMINYICYNPVARLIAYKPTSFMNSLQICEAKNFFYSKSTNLVENGIR